QTRQHLESLSIIPFGTSAFLPASEADVQGLEKRLRCSLPCELRTILLIFGESTFDNEVIFIGQDGGRYIFGCFFGLQSIIDTLNSPPDQFPPGCLAIGDEGLGNLYCLGLHGHLAGKVLYWDHEVGWGEAERFVSQDIPIPEGVNTPCLRVLANSFGEFVVLLQKA